MLLASSLINKENYYYYYYYYHHHLRISDFLKEGLNSYVLDHKIVNPDLNYVDFTYSLSALDVTGLFCNALKNLPPILCIFRQNCDHLSRTFQNFTVEL
jgi:hypothetical protein